MDLLQPVFIIFTFLLSSSYPEAFLDTSYQLSCYVFIRPSVITVTSSKYFASMALSYADFNYQLAMYDLPRAFAGHDFNVWTCVQLRRLIKLFDPERTFFKDELKIDLCEDLIGITNSVLTRSEQRAVDSIWKGWTVEQASSLLRHESAMPYATSSTDTNTTGVKRLHSEVEVDVETVPADKSTPNLSTENTMLECDTCTNVISVSELLTIPRDASCKHPTITSCKECVKIYIQTQTQSVSLDSIKCPKFGCFATLSHHQMIQYASPDVFDRYSEYIAKKSIEQMAEYYPCASPGCSAGGLCFPEDQASNSFVTCNKCGTRTCMTCDTLWHPNLSHEQNLLKIKEAEEEKRPAKEKRDEAASKAMVSKESTPCPGKGCGARIKKTGGCDHMTCKSNVAQQRLGC